MSKCISQLQLNEWECNQGGAQYAASRALVGRTADTIGLGITNTDTRTLAICPSVRPTDRRTPSVYLPRNFSRYQVRRGFASPSPGEAASHSGKRELPSLTPSLARSLPVRVWARN